MLKQLAVKAMWSLFGGILLTCSVVASAGNFPDRPVKLIVPFAPGGGTDTAARLLGRQLAAVLGQSVIVENRSGAGGVLAAELVMKSAPDGYTLLLCDTSYAINAGLRSKNSSNNALDLVAVAHFASSPMALAVRSNLQVRNVKELLDLARVDPNKLSVGSAGNGSIGHLSKALFDNLAGVQTMHVPYKGSSAATADLISGQIDAVFGTLPSLLGFAKSGRIRILAVTSLQRSSLAPDIPSVSEAGGPNLAVASWFGIVTPVNTSQDVIARIDTAIARVSEMDAFQDALKQQGMERSYLGRAEFSKFLKSEISRWKAIGVSANITME